MHAASGPGTALAQLFEVRFVCRCGCDGTRHVRGVSEDDVIAEVQENASSYGICHESPLVVTAVPLGRIEMTVHGLLD